MKINAHNRLRNTLVANFFDADDKEALKHLAKQLKGTLREKSTGFAEITCASFTVTITSGTSDYTVSVKSADDILFTKTHSQARGNTLADALERILPDLRKDKNRAEKDVKGLQDLTRKTVELGSDLSHLVSTAEFLAQNLR